MVNPNPNGLTLVQTLPSPDPLCSEYILSSLGLFSVQKHWAVPSLGIVSIPSSEGWIGNKEVCWLRTGWH